MTRRSLLCAYIYMYIHTRVFMYVDTSVSTADFRQMRMWLWRETIVGAWLCTSCRAWIPQSIRWKTKSSGLKRLLLPRTTPMRHISSWYIEVLLLVLRTPRTTCFRSWCIETHTLSLLLSFLSLTLSLTLSLSPFFSLCRRTVSLSITFSLSLSLSLSLALSLSLSYTHTHAHTRTRKHTHTHTHTNTCH